jgi:hypothetical protein
MITSELSTTETRCSPGPEPNDSVAGDNSAAEAAEEGSGERPDSEVFGNAL